MILDKEKANEWLYKMINDPMIDEDFWERKGQHIRDDICYYLDKNGKVDLKELAKVHDDTVFWLYNKYFGGTNMQDEILKIIEKDKNVIDVEFDDIVNSNADYLVFFENNDKVMENIKDLKNLIEYKFNTSVHLLSEQIEDQINEGEELISIDFYVDIW